MLIVLIFTFRLKLNFTFVLRYIFFNWCKISNDMKVYTDETMYMKSFQNVQLHVLAGMLVPYWQGKTG